MSNCTEHRGSLFEAPVACIVNPVNCQGVMGKGLALEFKQRFPDVFRDYERMCQRNELKPGVLHTYQLSDGKWVVNFPTKTFWRQPSKLQYVQAGLPALVEFVMMNAVGSIAIPALGCGLGGLSWPSVKREIEVAFDVIPSGNVNVWLFPPK